MSHSKGKDSPCSSTPHKDAFQDPCNIKYSIALTWRCNKILSEVISGLLLQEFSKICKENCYFDLKTKQVNWQDFNNSHCKATQELSQRVKRVFCKNVEFEVLRSKEKPLLMII